jgi:RNA polymerase sigma factor (sigma-70 family)
MYSPEKVQFFRTWQYLSCTCEKGFKIKAEFYVTPEPNFTLIIQIGELMDIQERGLKDPASDFEIISRILAGEKQAYSTIVRRYNQRLYRVAMSMISDDREVEDVMQVAYIKAYENLPKFQFKSSFSTWLTRILINESLLRLKIRNRSVNMEDHVLDTEINKQNEVETPVSTMLNAELKSAIDQAISQLPDKYRTVFIMREIEEMNVAETGACLDISEVNVKVRLNRAKSLLRESLSSLYKNEDLLHFHLSRCDRMVQMVMNRI